MIGVVVFALGAVLIGQAFASRGTANAGRPHVTFGEDFDRVLGPVVGVHLPERAVVALEVAAPVAGAAFRPPQSSAAPAAAPVDEEMLAAEPVAADPEVAGPTLEATVRSRPRFALPRFRMPRFRFSAAVRRADASATELADELAPTAAVDQPIHVDNVPLGDATPTVDAPDVRVLPIRADGRGDAVQSHVDAVQEPIAGAAAPVAAHEAREPVTADVASPAFVDIVSNAESGEDDRIAHLLLADLTDIPTPNADVAPASSLQPNQPNRSASMSIASRFLSIFARRPRAAVPVFDASLVEWNENDDVMSSDVAPAAAERDSTPVASIAADEHLARATEQQPALVEATASAGRTDAGVDTGTVPDGVNAETHSTLPDEFGISPARLAELALKVEQNPSHQDEPAAGVATQAAEETAAQQAEQVEHALRMAQEAAAAAARSEQEQCSRWAAQLVGRTGVVPIAERRKLLEFYLADPTDPESRSILAAVIAEDPELAPLAQSAMAEAA